MKPELASSFAFWIAAGLAQSGPMPIVYYFAMIERTRRGYGVFFPRPGCASPGTTVAEAAINAEEALAGHLLVSEEHGDELAEPSQLIAGEADPDVEKLRGFSCAGRGAERRTGVFASTATR
jgi:predicted RNase H-like HicB family nuclease